MYKDCNGDSSGLSITLFGTHHSVENSMSACEVKARRLPCGGSEKVHCQPDRNEKKCDCTKFDCLMGIMLTKITRTKESLISNDFYSCILLIFPVFTRIPHIVICVFFTQKSACIFGMLCVFTGPKTY
jgi:hypothetical protein